MNDTQPPTTIKRGRGRPKKNKQSTLLSADGPNIQTNDMIILPFLHGTGDTQNANLKTKKIDLIKKKKVKLDKKRSSSHKVSKEADMQRDKSAHNLEEKLRKSRINQLIANLGNLLFGENCHKHTKRYILEKTHERLQNLHKDGEAPVHCSNEAGLIKRIKELEESIVVLLELLRKHNISPPEQLNFPSVRPTSVEDKQGDSTTSDEHQEVDSNTSAIDTDHLSETNQVNGIPLQIHLVLPTISLTQIKTSSVITLTATATEPLNTTAKSKQNMYITSSSGSDENSHRSTSSDNTKHKHISPSANTILAMSSSSHLTENTKITQSISLTNTNSPSPLVTNQDILSRPPISTKDSIVLSPNVSSHMLDNFTSNKAIHFETMSLINTEEVIQPSMIGAKDDDSKSTAIMKERTVESSILSTSMTNKSHHHTTTLQSKSKEETSSTIASTAVNNTKGTSHVVSSKLLRRGDTSRTFTDNNNSHDLMVNRKTQELTKISISKTSTNQTLKVDRSHVCNSVVTSYSTLMPVNSITLMSLPSNTIESSHNQNEISEVFQNIVDKESSRRPTFSSNCRSVSASINSKNSVTSLSTSKVKTNRQSIKASVNTTESSSKTGTTQGFGIDNLLISNLRSTCNIVPNSVNPSTVITSNSDNTVLTSVCDHGNTNKTTSQRPRLPSSGHTVASLLESTTTNAKNSDYNVISESRKLNTKDLLTNSASAQTKGDLKSNQPVAASKPSSVKADPVVTSSSKRWGNFVESAQKSDAFLTSFVLSSNHKVRRRRRKLKGETPVKGGTTVNSRAPVKVGTPVKDGNQDKDGTSVKRGTQVVAGTSTKKADNQIEKTKEQSSPLKRPIQPLASQVSRKVPATLPSQPPVMHTSISSSRTATEKPNQAPQPTMSSLEQSSTVYEKSKSTSNLSKNIPSVTTSKISTTETTATSTTILSHPILPTIARTSISTTQNQCQPSTNVKTVNRSMKDRTIKNKWLVTTNDKIQTVLNISTPDGPTDQCASPVISYPNPNTGKRKRKTSFNTTSQSKQRLSKPCTPLQNTFSAESLSRPSQDHNKAKKLKLVANQILPNLSRHSFPGGNVSQQKFQIPTDPTNTLPTILNIFAPAPVPSTQHTQQQTFHSAFSNFSAENLVGNECQLGVMDSNNLNETNFSENMLMAANSQLFTNFSADSLIAANEPQMPFAINNLINQPNNTWNQAWLPQDVNEAIFQNMGANQQSNSNVVRQNTRQIQPPPSTECSPIKSIMSILNSTPNNNPGNFHFDNFSSGLPNMFQNNPLHMNERSMPRDINRTHMMNDNPDFFMTTWQGKIDNTMRSMPNAPSWNTYTNLISRTPAKPALNHQQPGNIHPSTFQNNNKIPGRTKEVSGPMFGNISLVNSMTSS